MLICKTKTYSFHFRFTKNLERHFETEICLDDYSINRQHKCRQYFGMFYNFYINNFGKNFFQKRSSLSALESIKLIQ